MYTLAHLSDPHVPPLARPAVGDLMSKRLLGYLSWQRHRKRIHRLDVLESLTDDLSAQRPDHVVVTGDLVNISLPAEFETALRWLDRLGPADRVTVVPGNHDAYVRVPWAETWRHWRDYMSSEDGNGPARVPEDFADFPLVRRRGPLAIVGTSSAVPSPPGMATGQLGPQQLDRLEKHLHALEREGCFRVILVHHPPLGEGTGHRKRLTDSAALHAVLARAGAELILHGHDHIFSNGEIEGAGGPVPVFGVPSASALAHGSKPAAHYHLFELEQAPEGWRLTVRTRGYQQSSGKFGPGTERHLLVVREHAASMDA